MFTTLFVIGVVLSSCSKGGPTVVIHTSEGDYSVQVELARTDPEKRRGLMFRESLPPGQGMLFFYDNPLRPSFWMKNTLIPLDMLFIGADSRIVDIAQDQQPCVADPCPSYTASAESTFVLEIPAGQARAQGVSVGDSVELP